MRLAPLALLAASSSTLGQTALSATDAVRQAFAGRATIATNRQRLEEARRNAAAAGAYPATRLDLGTNLFNRTDINGSADLLVYQPLDVFGKTRALRGQGRAALATALAAFRQGALDVQQEALTAYANLLSAQRLLAGAKVQRDLAESVRASTEKRVAARDLPEIQGARSALEVQRADGLVADRRAAVEVARLRLAAALGTDTLPDEAQLAALESPSEPPGDPAAGRPELLALRAEAAQAVADERVAKQGLLPDLQIQAGRNSFEESGRFNARLQLTATLWDNGATRDRIKAAEARRRAAEAALQDRLKGASKEIAAAQVEFAAAERSVRSYTNLAEGAQTLLERTQRGFDLGANTLVDVLDARRALADAQELMVNAQLRRDLAIEGVLRFEGTLPGGAEVNKVPLLTLILLAGCGKPAAKEEAADVEPPAATVELATVDVRDMRDTLSVDGTFVLPQGASSRLAPSVVGRLAEVDVKEGDRVAAGQLLARIDTRALVAQSQSAAAGAAAAAATAAGSETALRAARVDQAASVHAARLALDVAVSEAKFGVEGAAVDLQRLRAGARPQEIAQAQQAVDQARIARDKARLDADRDVRLLKEGLVAGSQADASAAAVRTAGSILRSAEAALDLVRAGTRPEELRASELRLSSTRELAARKVAQARAALAQAQADALEVDAKAQEAAAARLAADQKAADARAAAASVGAGEIRSPIAGTVVRRFLNPGDVADTTTPVLMVASSRPVIDFVGNVSPSEARRVAEGMAVLAGEVQGTVTSVGEADSATGLVSIRAHLATKERAGGFATVQIVLAVRRGTLTVPRGAVLERESKDAVFVAKDGTAHLTEVELGREENGRVAVLKGLAKGQRVVVLGGNEISDGAKIEEAPKEGAKEP